MYLQNPTFQDNPQIDNKIFEVLNTLMNLLIFVNFSFVLSVESPYFLIFNEEINFNFYNHKIKLTETCQ